ncbi:MAG TPA: transglutaminase-like domain-containing protein [Thermoanaerobaculia bacterium]|nr:transglutaminase-like domain-containing protein [Thermoanaerobaculia bacterium]
MASTSEPNGPVGFRELWSAQDRQELDVFLGAVRRDDLVAGLLAVAGAGPEEADACKRRIAEWGRVLASRMPSPAVSSARQQVAALTRLLSFEEGFKGDEDDYHDPRNSLLPEVIERRRGMPILLSCLWIAVGRAAGVRVEGIGLPGRFIVRVGGSSGVFADPFAGGAVVGEDDCRRTVKELSGGTIEWSDDFLNPARTDQILERVLQN